MTIRTVLVAVPNSHANYPDGLTPLPGTLADVEVMSDLLTSRGAPNQRTLKGHDASLGDVQAALQELADQTGPRDVAIFYFAGHGVGLIDTSRDEDDGVDEALVCDDGFLLDDWFAGFWLDTVQPGSAWVMVVDACASKSVVMTLDKTLVRYPKPPDFGLLHSPLVESKPQALARGSAARIVVVDAQAADAPPVGAPPVARLVLAACGDNESATELGPSGGKGARGLFTSMLDAHVREHPDALYLDLPEPLTDRVLKYKLNDGHASRPRFYYDPGAGQLQHLRALAGDSST